MAVHTAGIRIAAVRNATETTVYLYGRGVYAGDFPRPGSGEWSQEGRDTALRAVADLDNADELRAADDAWTVKTVARTVASGRRTQEEADRYLAEYRRQRAEREAARAATSLKDQATALLQQMDLNPRLDLDGGGTVWGFECWWMPEDQFDREYGARTVVEVPLPEREGTAGGTAAADPDPDPPADPARPAARRRPRLRPRLPLSTAETELLRMAANGQTDQAIADTRGTSLNTVVDQMKTIRLKLRAANRAHAVALGLALGLVDSTDVTVPDDITHDNAHAP